MQETLAGGDLPHSATRLREFLANDAFSSPNNSFRMMPKAARRRTLAACRRVAEGWIGFKDVRTARAWQLLQRSVATRALSTHRIQAVTR